MVKNTKVGLWCSYVTYATGVIQTRRWTRRSSFLYVCHILFSCLATVDGCRVSARFFRFLIYSLVIVQLHDSSCSSCKSPLNFSVCYSLPKNRILIGPSINWAFPSTQLAACSSIDLPTTFRLGLYLAYRFSE